MKKKFDGVIKYYLIIAGCYGIFLIILTLVEATRITITHEQHFLFTYSSASAGRFLTSMVRTLNQITAIIVTASAIAVPLTANFYTPKLIEMFIQNGVNRSFFLLLISATIMSEYTHYLVVQTIEDVIYPVPTMFYISFAMGFASMFCFPPYLYYVFNFLKPDEIIRRIGHDIDLHLERAVSNSRTTTSSAYSRIRKALIAKIAQLNEIVIRAIDRSDRDIALSALEELQKMAIKYQKLKTRFDWQWFAISPEEERGLPEEAINILIQERTWFEFKILHHLEVAYTSALNKMWQVVAQIAEIAHIVGKTARAKNDNNVLALSIKFMNTYMRQCINRHDIRAFYNTSYRYRNLAEDIATVSPMRSLEIIKYLNYYGMAALDKDMMFAWDITFYDIGHIVEYVYRNNIEEQRKFLTAFLNTQNDSASLLASPQGGVIFHTTGTIKAILILLSYYLETDLSEEIQILEDYLQTVNAKLVHQAADELLRVEGKEFWEIIDRIVNFDYLEESRRMHLKEFISTWKQIKAC